MRRLVLLVALLSACKAMGGLGHAASGLGHIASSVGHVAGDVGHASSALARVAAPAGKLVQKALPIANDVVSAMLVHPGMINIQPDDPPENNGETVSMAGPLIDNHDACNACPEDIACDQCAVGGQACRWASAGSFARCESVAAQ
jgi:hypothetical protein